MGEWLLCSLYISSQVVCFLNKIVLTESSSLLSCVLDKRLSLNVIFLFLCSLIHIFCWKTLVGGFVLTRQICIRSTAWVPIFWWAFYCRQAIFLLNYQVWFRMAWFQIKKTFEEILLEKLSVFKSYRKSRDGSFYNTYSIAYHNSAIHDHFSRNVPEQQIPASVINAELWVSCEGWNEIVIFSLAIDQWIILRFVISLNKRNLFDFFLFTWGILRPFLRIFILPVWYGS